MFVAVTRFFAFVSWPFDAQHGGLEFRAVRADIQGEPSGPMDKQIYIYI